MPRASAAPPFFRLTTPWVFVKIRSPATQRKRRLNYAGVKQKIGELVHGRSACAARAPVAEWLCRDPRGQVGGKIGLPGGLFHAERGEALDVQPRLGKRGLVGLQEPCRRLAQVQENTARSGDRLAGAKVSDEGCARRGSAAAGHPAVVEARRTAPEGLRDDGGIRPGRAADPG